MIPPQLISLALNIAPPLIGYIASSARKNPIDYIAGNYTSNQLGTSYSKGGKMKKISPNTVKVIANNPKLVDSVKTSIGNFDHNETITDNYVFSDSIVNPITNRTFAKDNELLARSDAKVAKRAKYDASAKNTLRNNAAKRSQLIDLQEAIRKYVLGIDDRRTDEYRDGYQYGSYRKPTVDEMMRYGAYQKLLGAPPIPSYPSQTYPENRIPYSQYPTVQIQEEEKPSRTTEPTVRPTNNYRAASKQAPSSYDRRLANARAKVASEINRASTGRGTVRLSSSRLDETSSNPPSNVPRQGLDEAKIRAIVGNVPLYYGPEKPESLKTYPTNSTPVSYASIPSTYEDATSSSINVDPRKLPAGDPLAPKPDPYLEPVIIGTIGVPKELVGENAINYDATPEIFNKTRDEIVDEGYGYLDTLGTKKYMENLVNFFLSGMRGGKRALDEDGNLGFISTYLDVPSFLERFRRDVVKRRFNPKDKDPKTYAYVDSRYALFPSYAYPEDSTIFKPNVQYRDKKYFLHPRLLPPLAKLAEEDAAIRSGYHHGNVHLKDYWMTPSGYMLSPYSNYYGLPSRSFANETFLIGSDKPPYKYDRTLKDIDFSRFKYVPLKPGQDPYEYMDRKFANYPKDILKELVEQRKKFILNDYDRGIHYRMGFAPYVNRMVQDTIPTYLGYVRNDKGEFIPLPHYDLPLNTAVDHHRLVKDLLLNRWMINVLPYYPQTEFDIYITKKALEELGYYPVSNVDRYVGNKKLEFDDQGQIKSIYKYGGSIDKSKKLRTDKNYQFGSFTNSNVANTFTDAIRNILPDFNSTGTTAPLNPEQPRQDLFSRNLELLNSSTDRPNYDYTFPAAGEDNTGPINPDLDPSALPTNPSIRTVGLNQSSTDSLLGTTTTRPKLSAQQIYDLLQYMELLGKAGIVAAGPERQRTYTSNTPINFRTYDPSQALQQSRYGFNTAANSISNTVGMGARNAALNQLASNNYRIISDILDRYYAMNQRARDAYEQALDQRQRYNNASRLQADIINAQNRGAFLNDLDTLFTSVGNLGRAKQDQLTQQKGLELLAKAFESGKFLFNE